MIKSGMGNHFIRRISQLLPIILWLLLPMLARSQAVIIITGPTNIVTAGGTASIWVNALNVSTQQVSWLFPASFPCHLTTGEKTVEVWAQARDHTESGAADIAPGAFVRHEYLLQIPGDWTGEVTVQPREISATRLALNVEAPVAAEAGETNAPSRGMIMGIMSGEWHMGKDGNYDPQNFFKEHIFGYEPFYFIAGTESPNIKFQISFKYRLLNEHGWLAEKPGWHWLTGLDVAYTQQSLWDWSAPSSPFYDSTYMPELLYSWDRFVGGGPTNWFRLDWQTGLKHQSNGKSGADSRSLNIAYFQPTLTFGRDNGFQLTFTPRIWAYLGSLSDNPDIKDYRGYGDLRTTIGWQHGLELSALTNAGKDFKHGSLELDLTYPLMHPPHGALSIYVMAQYFTGYGESLLGYNQKSDQFRLGLSLYR